MASTKKLFAALTRRGPHRVLRGDLAFAGQPGVVYTPEKGTNLPAVAFAHDWITSTVRYEGTLDHLASWGIVAAAHAHRDRPRPVGAQPRLRLGHHARHHHGCAAGARRDQRQPEQARPRGPRLRGVGRGVRRGRSGQKSAQPRRRCWPPIRRSPARPPRGPAAGLTVPGLILTDPGDPMSLRSNAVELARAWKTATLRATSNTKAGGLVEGRTLAKVVGLPGADRGTQKIVRALTTGFLLHLLAGDKTYRDFSDAEVDLPKAPVMDPFADDPADLENKVVALLKP